MRYLILLLIVLLLTGCSSEIENEFENEEEDDNSQTNTQTQDNTQDNQQTSSISLTDLNNHDSKTDCWVAYEGKVYDITDWLPKHPGSSAAIEPYCGTSSEFEEAFSGQHGTSQVNKLIEESVLIGDFNG